MTVRRFNYTKRQKIPRSQVLCSLHHSAGVLTLDAEFDLEGTDLDRTADIYLEAQRGMDRQRFYWGTVGSPTVPDKRTLEKFTAPDGITFRLVVSGCPDSAFPGLILAEASNIRPRLRDENSGSGNSLLRVAVDPSLGQRVWRLDQQDDGPVLQINPNVGGKAWAATAAFRATVLPACVKEVLITIVADNRPTDWPVDEPDENDWRSLWLWWACDLIGDMDLPQDESKNFGAIVDWADNIVEAFVRKIRAVDMLESLQEEVARDTN